MEVEESLLPPFLQFPSVGKVVVLWTSGYQWGADYREWTAGLRLVSDLRG